MSGRQLRGERSRARRHPEQRLVERLDEPERSPWRSVSTRARRSASRTIEPALSRRRAATSSARSFVSSRSRTAARIEAAQAPSPAPSKAVSASLHLPGAERLVGEERELPAVERLAELAVLVGERQPLAELGGDAGSNRVEPDSIAERLRRRDREQRRDSQGPEVEPFEDDRPGGDRACGREPKRADGVGELAGGVGRLAVARVELARQLENAEPVDVPPELRRHQPERLGPERGELARNDGADADPPPSSAGSPGGEADERRDRRVGARGAEERLLDRRRRRSSKASSFQSNPPERSATAASVGSRIVWKRASSSVVPSPECAFAKIAAAGSRRRSSIALRVSGSRRSVGACSATKVADERPVLVERRPVAGRMLLEGERKLGAALGREGREAERAQGLVEVRCPDRHEFLLRGAAADLLRGCPVSSPRYGSRETADREARGRQAVRARDRGSRRRRR